MYKIVDDEYIHSKNRVYCVLCTQILLPPQNLSYALIKLSRPAQIIGVGGNENL